MNTMLDNPLEQALKHAADEPAHRPAFFNLLLESTVYVLGEAGDGWIAGAARVGHDEPVDLQHWQKPDGGSAIPFFTSVSALQQAVKETQPFLALPARTLFAMTAGAELFLNPKLAYGKAFGPDEITALLNNEGDALTEREILEGEMRITLSEPEQKPTQMIDSLTALFAQLKQVRRAFIVQVQDAPHENPHWLIGLECDGNEYSAITAVGQVATDTAPDDEPVDICLIGEHEPGISHYFTRHITPFYERKWGSWLRNMHESGAH